MQKQNILYAQQGSLLKDVNIIKVAFSIWFVGLLTHIIELHTSFNRFSILLIISTIYYLLFNLFLKER
jgi:hypothetical protein